jgi:hypothetical protein
MLTKEEDKMLREIADTERDEHFKTPMKCEECGKPVSKLHDIGEGEFVMRFCKQCHESYLEDISGV